MPDTANLDALATNQWARHAVTAEILFLGSAHSGRKADIAGKEDSIPHRTLRDTPEALTRAHCYRHEQSGALWPQQEGHRFVNLCSATVTYCTKSHAAAIDEIGLGSSLPNLGQRERTPSPELQRYLPQCSNRELPVTPTTTCKHDESSEHSMTA